MTSVVVETDDLRRALVALRGHVPSPTDWPELARIHCTVRDQVLELTATDMYAAALAIVSVYDLEDGEVGGTFNIEQAEIAHVLGLFRPRRGAGAAEEMGDSLRLEVKGADGDLIVTDVSGLFPGRSVTLPRLGTATDDDFPDVAQIISTARAVAGRQTDRIVANAHLLAGFEKASRAYGEPLVLEPTGVKGGSLLISCGESFLGMLTTIKPSAEDEAKMLGWAEAWEPRLPSPRLPEKAGRKTKVTFKPLPGGEDQ